MASLTLPLPTWISPSSPGQELSPLLQDCLSLALHDKLLMHVLLLVSAMKLESKPGSHEDFLFVAHTREGINLLRSRIVESASTISNGTLASVAILAAVEVRCSSMSLCRTVLLISWQYSRNRMTAMKTHMDGLHRMIDIRGGLAKVRLSSPVTANVIFW